jgi:excisionase family DNA binding protein
MQGEHAMPKAKLPDALVLTIEEACRLVRLSRASLYRAMDAKQLRYLKYGTRRLIARSDLDDFINSLRVN